MQSASNPPWPARVRVLPKARLRGRRASPSTTRCLLALAAMALVLVSAPVTRTQAHAPPEVRRTLRNERDDSVVVVTNRGLIFGSASGGDWSIMCSLALGIPVGAQADYARLSDGRLLAATTEGLQVTDNQGCDWRPVAPFGDVAASTLAQHPSEPDTLYLGIAGGARGGIEQSDDGGATWNRLWAIAEEERVAQILVAPSQPRRLYANGNAADQSGELEHFLARSSDAGRNWERLPVPVQEGEQEAILLAVAPSDPERLLMLITHSQRGAEPDRLLLSRDGGESFSELWADLELSDADFTPDGEQIWIAGSYGLFRTQGEGGEVSKVGGAQLMTSVEPGSDRLYAAGHHSGFDPVGAGLGASVDDGETFELVLAFPQVTRPIACPDTSATPALCEELWLDWKLEIIDALTGIPPEEPTASVDAGNEDPPSRDAGSRRADASSGARKDARPDDDDESSREEPSESDTSGGCSLHSGTSPSDHDALLALLVCAGFVRMRRRARARRAPPAG